MTVGVRQIRAGEVEQAKRLRLAALADAPRAFLSRLADEEVMPASAWRERVAENAEGIRNVCFFAVVDGAERGLVVGVRSEEAPERAELVSLWVAPEARGRGAGRALVEAVCDWARQRGCREVTLCVTEAAGAAIALYRACGFVETGPRCPFAPDPAIQEIRMTRTVAPR